MTTVKTIGFGELSTGVPGAGASVVVVMILNPPGRVSVIVRLVVDDILVGSVVDETISDRIVTTGSAAVVVVVFGREVVVKLAAPFFDLNDSKLPTIAASEIVSGSSVSSSGSGSVTSCDDADGDDVVVVEVVVDEGVVDSAGANVIESVELLRAKVLGVNALMVVKRERRPSVVV